jgi:hypothetical protein
LRRAEEQCICPEFRSSPIRSSRSSTFNRASRLVQLATGSLEPRRRSVTRYTTRHSFLNIKDHTMLDWLLVTFCAALLIDVDSLNSFFDVFTPLYAVAIIALLIYLRLQGGEANTVTK